VSGWGLLTVGVRTFYLTYNSYLGFKSGRFSPSEDAIIQKNFGSLAASLQVKSTYNTLRNDDF